MLKIRLHRLVGVYTCQNATLLEITCHGSNSISAYKKESDGEKSEAFKKVDRKRTG